MKAAWNVTYEIVTEESAAEGEASERGYIVEGGTLREAWQAWRPGGRYVQADTCPVSLECPPWWMTAHDEPDYRTGEAESRSLHIPESVTAASRLRLARLAGCYGVEVPRGATR